MNRKMVFEYSIPSARTKNLPRKVIMNVKDGVSIEKTVTLHL